MWYEIRKKLLKLSVRDEIQRGKQEAELAYKHGKITSDEKDKEIATLDKQPYVKVLSMELDENNPKVGSFELDWNDTFVEQLKEAGYVGTTNENIIDDWFNDICKNIAFEEFNEQNFIVEPPSVSASREDGKTEHS